MTDLADADVRRYLDDGFLVVPGLVAPDEVAELRADLVAIARGRYPHPALPPRPDSESDAEVLRAILCIHQPHLVSPVARRAMAHPRIVAALKRLVGAHLAWSDGAVKAMQSMAFVKPPGFPGNPWHQDEAAIPTRDRSLTAAWIALDDATLANGCLWAVPGSHRSGRLYDRRPHDRREEFDDTWLAEGFDEAAAVPIEVPCGAVVFFNGYLLHASRPNRSDGWRRVLVNHYMSAASLLPWRVLPDENPALADRRAVIPIAGDDPYRDKGYDEPPVADVWLRTCLAAERARAGAG